MRLGSGLGVMRQLDFLARIAVPKPVTVSSDGCGGIPTANVRGLI
jgi:hypothetical protein